MTQTNQDEPRIYDLENMYMDVIFGLKQGRGRDCVRMKLVIPVCSCLF